MAKTKETVAERIEIVNQPDEDTKKGGLKLRITIPLILLGVALSVFLLVRRFNSNDD